MEETNKKEKKSLKEFVKENQAMIEIGIVAAGAIAEVAVQVAFERRRLVKYGQALERAGVAIIRAIK